MKFEAKDHMEDIKEQKEAMKTTSAPGLERFAGKGREKVAGHKQAVDALQARIE